MFSASFRQGITTDTSIDGVSSVASTSEDLLFCAVLISFGLPAPGSRFGCSAPECMNARQTEKWRAIIENRHAYGL